MTKFSTRCPYCMGEMRVERMRCRSCNTAVEGDFENSPLSVLSPEQQAFVVDFLKLSGNIKALAANRDVSYPTLRARLDRIIEAVSGPAEKESQQKRNVLDALEKGEITADQAADILKANKGQ